MDLIFHKNNFIFLLTPLATLRYCGRMFKTVKISEKEYREIRALAKKQGKFLQFLLNEAVRQYLLKENQKAA